MEEKRRIRLRWRRLVCYLLILLAAASCYIVLRSYLLLMVVLLLVGVLAVSVFGACRLAESIQVVLCFSERQVIQGETLELKAELTGRRWISLECLLSLTAENIFLESSSPFEISLPVRADRMETCSIPLRVKRLGYFRVKAERIRVRDLLGILEIAVPALADCETSVIPRITVAKAQMTLGLLAGMSENEESHRKGSDFSEVNDIRAYIPGDKLRDIHWKLSAKQAELMVKERVSMTGAQMMILLKLSGNKQEAEELIQKFADMAGMFLFRKTPICLLIWNAGSYTFEEYGCDNMEELKRAFAAILRVPLSARAEEQQLQYLKNCYPFLGTYLCMEYRDGQVQVVMRDNV